jgi:molecular chaperone GrpE
MDNGERETSEAVRVNDRRRFDSSGNPKGEEKPTPARSSSWATSEPKDGARGGAKNADVASENVKAKEKEGENEVDPRAAEVTQLKTDLEGARKRVDELARAYQAVDRDREDFKARLSREREQLLDVERGKVAVTVLEAIDELDLCLDACASDTSPLSEGVRLIRENLLKKLEAMGVERLSLDGQPFDPAVAEAADMQLTTLPEDDQRILSVVRAGYRMKGRIIRPARVRVAKYVEPAKA